MPTFYKILIAGQLDPCWSEWLNDLTITPLETGDTLLSGPMPDQASLYGLLSRLRDMNLELLSLDKNTAGK